MSREIKDNNPGGIVRVPGVTWKGQSPFQDDPKFVTFTSPEYGIRAMVRVLRSYDREGFNTLRHIINRWAPDNENNVQAYLDDVCERCGRLPDAPIDINAMMPQLVHAIIWHENGSFPYSWQQVDAGIALA